MTIETEKNQGKVEWFNTGTIGHVDHGKTSLTAAIATYSGKYGRGKVRTYESIDKAPEERARGITINSTIIDYYGPSGRRYSHTDCPGHADYVKNMITGSSQMDGAILVVAATDGAMPQTKEHLLLAKQIGVKQIIVYLNKMDIANLEMTELVIEEIKELLEKFEFDRDCPVIKGSAAAALTELTKNLPETEIGAKSIGKLIETMDSYFHTPERSVDKPFYAFIEGVYSSPGRGTVCTGKIEQGTIKAGEEVEIIGLSEIDSKNKKRDIIKTVVTSIEAFNKPVTAAEAGMNVGLLLRGVSRESIEKGQVICKPGSQKCYSEFDATVYVLTKDEGGRSTPFFNNYKPQLFVGTANISVVSLIILHKSKDGEVDERKTDSVTLETKAGEDGNTDRVMAMPGDSVIVRIKLQKDIVLNSDSLITLREGGRTVAAGHIFRVIA